MEIARRHDEEGRNEESHEERLDEAEERQLEHEEADVAMEDRVRHRGPYRRGLAGCAGRAGGGR